MIKKKLLLLVPVLFGLTIVFLYGVNVLMGDEWITIELFKHILSEGFNFSTLFQWNYEHSIFFPNILFLINVYLFNFNVKVNMFGIQIMIALVYFIYLLYLKQTQSVQAYYSWRNIIFMIALGFCCFNLVQWGNFLHGFQLAYLMAGFGAILSFYFLSHARRGGVFYLAILIGIIASFSSSHGMFVWATYIGVCLLMFISKEKVDKKSFLIIFAIGILLAIIYAYNSPNAINLKINIFEMPLRFFSGFGNFLYFNKRMPMFILAFAPILGFIVFAIGIVMTIKFVLSKRVNENMFPLLIFYYSCAYTGATTIGRPGIMAAFSSVYTTFSSLLAIISISIMIYQEYILSEKGNKQHKKIASSFLTIILSIIFIQNFFLIKRCNNIYYEQMKLIPIILDYNRQDFKHLRKAVYDIEGNYDNQGLRHSTCTSIKSYKRAYDNVNFLAKNRLNVFSNVEYVSKKEYTYGNKYNLEEGKKVLSVMNRINLKSLQESNNSRVFYSSGKAINPKYIYIKFSHGKDANQIFKIFYTNQNEEFPEWSVAFETQVNEKEYLITLYAAGDNPYVEFDMENKNKDHSVMKPYDSGGNDTKFRLYSDEPYEISEFAVYQ